MQLYHNTVPVPDTINIYEWIDIRIVGSFPMHQQIRELSAPDEKCWVNWRFVTRDGKLTKVPYMPNGQHAKSTDSSTWSTFDEALAAQDRFDGIGIFFTGKLLGIDIDHCLVNGAVSREIATIVEKARTYTEVSPSGAGLHLYLKLTEPMALEGNRSPREQGGDYECYTAGRYFTVTGQPWTMSYPLRTVAPEEALAILRLIGYPWGAETLTSTQTNPAETVLLNDEVLLEKMFSSKNGAKIEALYNGDISAFGGDESAADASLCSHLAFWTGKDASRITSLWLASPLGARSKTQDRKDYQERTVNFTLANCAETFGASSSHLVDIGQDNQIQDSQTYSLPFNVISGPELLAMSMPPVEWQIESLFAKGTLNMISAHPNQYKSWLVMRMALSVAHGSLLFNEFETTRCNVLYVNEEDNCAENKRRYRKLLQDGEQADRVFFVIESGRKIDVKWATDILQVAEAHNIGFVILDSLSALHLENENESHSMQLIMDNLRILIRKGLTVLLTHHNRKGNGEKNGEQSDSGMDMARGSTAITAAIHSHITCHEKKTGGGYLVISQHKLKAATKLKPFMLRIVEPSMEGLISFDYVGHYNDDMGAADAMGAKLMLHFREYKNEYFTRKRLAELKFATSAEDQTLRLALKNLVEKHQLESKKCTELSGADQKLVLGKSPRSNTIVYKFTADGPIDIDVSDIF